MAEDNVQYRGQYTTYRTAESQLSGLVEQVLTDMARRVSVTDDIVFSTADVDMEIALVMVPGSRGK
jgi:hypothetical protein